MPECPRIEGPRVDPKAQKRKNQSAHDPKDTRQDKPYEQLHENARVLRKRMRISSIRHDFSHQPPRLIISIFL